MKKQQQITKNQHYIPQFYFREFSSSKKGIYRYDSQMPSNPPAFVSIRDECAEKYLYEMINGDGKLLEPNKLEKIFSQFENDFSNTLKSIKLKAFHKENYRTSAFLSKVEKYNLLVFICLQLLRLPKMIQHGQEVAKDVYNSEIDDRRAKNFAIEMYYNSLFRLKNQQEGPNITLPVLKWFDNMAFKIGVSDDDNIITSDLPMCFYNKNGLYPFEEIPDQVTVPLTSRLVLYLSPLKNEKIGERNILFPLDSEDIEEEQIAMFTMANRWVYSRNPLTDKQLKNVKKNL